jgi:hypothetical protein
MNELELLQESVSRYRLQVAARPARKRTVQPVKRQSGRKNFQVIKSYDWSSNVAKSNIQTLTIDKLELTQDQFRIVKHLQIGRSFTFMKGCIQLQVTRLKDLPAVYKRE